MLSRRDRVFRTFSRALLTGAQGFGFLLQCWRASTSQNRTLMIKVSPNLCVVGADAAVFLRMLMAQLLGDAVHIR